MSRELVKKSAILVALIGYLMLMIQGALLLPSKTFFGELVIIPIVPALTVFILLILLPKSNTVNIDYSEKLRLTQFEVWGIFLFPILCTIIVFVYVDFQRTYSGIDWLITCITVYVASSVANILRYKKKRT